jgi:hypothetical protein
MSKIQYAGPNFIGDFSWMIDHPEYAKCLFIFNDNERKSLPSHHLPNLKFLLLELGRLKEVFIYFGDFDGLNNRYSHFVTNH